MHARARLMVAALWAGSLWTVGYLVAPTLFATLADRVQAGTIAASMFRSQAWLSITCAALMFGLFAMAPHGLARQRACVLLVLAMLACTIVSHVGLQPMMAALRDAAGPGGVMESVAKTRFGVLHGVASLIYLVQSVLAGALLLKCA